MAGEGGYRRRGGGGEERFYCPPAMRGRYKQQQQQRFNHQQQQPEMNSNVNHIEVQSKVCSVESVKRIDSNDPPTTSFSSENLSNLDRFLEHTTPSVIAQQFPKTSMRGWKSNDYEFHAYFILGDLWESFREWSAYGAGVPLFLNGSDSVVQYYVPYLSGIQLYIDPSKPFVGQKRTIDESDADSSRETSSDGSSEGLVDRETNSFWGIQRISNTMTATIQGFNRLSLKDNNFMGLAADDHDVTNPPGLLIFEYLEQEPPYSREPLADKASPYSGRTWPIISNISDYMFFCFQQISVLASRFPEIKTLRSCDLTPASWISVAWYPIYRIPIGPTLQNVDTCFLTYHSLSTPLSSTSNDWPLVHGSAISGGTHDNGMSIKLSLPIFGLASYKFKVSDWNSNGTNDCPKVNSLLRAADRWLRLMKVNHPDYSFFISRNVYWR